MKLLPSLLTVLLTAAGANAASVVLYETGWEAAPASPAWVAGNVPPQNGWVNQNNVAGHVVVANGTAAAIVSGQAVTTPSGNQFHRFNASADTVTGFLRLAWTDLTAAFNARPPGHNLVTASLDVFVPATQSADASVYGIAAYDDTGAAAFGVFIDPSTRSLLLLVNNTFTLELANAIPFNTWTNIGVSANLVTGEIFVSRSGTPVPGLATVNAALPARTLTGVRLAAQNALTLPTTRSIFSDNFRVIAEQVALPRPRISIAQAGAGSWVLSWDGGLYGDWILESTDDPTAAVWATDDATPLILEGEALVVLFGEAPRRFYRLRGP